MEHVSLAIEQRASFAIESCLFCNYLCQEISFRSVHMWKMDLGTCQIAFQKNLQS